MTRRGLRQMLGHRVPGREQGQVMVIMAIALAMMLALTGLVVDYGRQIVMYREAQNASDAASLAAAYSIYAGTDLAAADAAGKLVAQQHGFPSGSVNITFLQADNATQATDPDQVVFVRTAVSGSLPTLFMGVFRISTMNVGVSSAASVNTGAPCVLCVLAPSGTALQVKGTGSVQVSGGGVIVNSSGDPASLLNGTGDLEADSIGVVGQADTTGTGSYVPSPQEGVSPVLDPLRNVPVPPLTGTDFGNTVNLTGNSNHTIGPGVYHDIKKVGNGDLTLEPGIYIITGDFDIGGNGELAGDNVLLYFTCGLSSSPSACSDGQSGGSLKVASSITPVILAGRNEYDTIYGGLLIFYDRKNESALEIDGGSTLTLTGTIYAKSSELKIGGNTSLAQVDSLVVAEKVTVHGTISINMGYQQDHNYKPRNLPVMVQ